MIADSDSYQNWFELPISHSTSEEEKKHGDIAETSHPERHVYKVPSVHPFNEEKDTYAKILIVDDNAFCLIAVVSLLTQY